MSEPEARKVFVTFEEYHNLVHLLVQGIAATRSFFEVQQVIAIARGGLFPGEVLSRVFEVPLAVMPIGSYKDEETKQGRLVFGQNLAMLQPLIRTGVLLVDELTDSGDTMVGAKDWLDKWYGLTGVRTATIWHKTRSTYRPDFFVEQIEPDRSGLYPWLVTPQEQRDLWLPHP